LGSLPIKWLERRAGDHSPNDVGFNQVEVWFSILQGQSLSGTSFTSLKQLQDHIDAYVRIQRKGRALCLDQEKGPATPFQRSPYHSALIPGTRTPGPTRFVGSLFISARLQKPFQSHDLLNPEQGIAKEPFSND
jgi:hypothetical protein